MLYISVKNKVKQLQTLPFKYLLSIIIASAGFHILQGQQLRITEWVTPPLEEKSPLLFIEFWATWCGPCRNVAPHVQQLAEISQGTVDFVQLSKESEYTVSKYCLEKGCKLPVAIDHNGYTHEKYQVHSLPFAVIVSGNDKIIWSGNPANLSLLDMEALVSQFKQQPTGQSKIQKVRATPKVQKKWIALGDITDSIFYRLSAADEPYVVAHKKDSLIVGGPTFIFQRLMNLPVHSVRMKDANIQKYELKYPYNKGKAALKEFLTQTSLIATRVDTVISSYRLSCASPELLWSDQIYDYGDGKYIKSDYSVEIDNVTVAELCPILNKITGHHFQVGSVQKGQVADWNIYHHTLPEMLQQLTTEYGLQVEPIKIDRINWILHPQESQFK